MYSLLVQLHSYTRYFLLLFLVIVLYQSFSGWRNQSAYNKQTDKMGLYLFISTHIQLLLGVALYFISPLVMHDHLGAAMKNKVYRFFTVEHATLMLAAIVLITLARLSIKKIKSDEGKYRRLFVFNLLALICILVAIPWPFLGEVGVGRHFLFHYF